MQEEDALGGEGALLEMREKVGDSRKEENSDWEIVSGKVSGIIWGGVNGPGEEP